MGQGDQVRRHQAGVTSATSAKYSVTPVPRIAATRWSSETPRVHIGDVPYGATESNFGVQAQRGFSSTDYRR